MARLVRSRDDGPEAVRGRFRQGGDPDPVEEVISPYDGRGRVGVGEDPAGQSTSSYGASGSCNSRKRDRRMDNSHVPDCMDRRIPDHRGTCRA